MEVSGQRHAAAVLFRYSLEMEAWMNPQAVYIFLEIKKSAPTWIRSSVRPAHSPVAYSTTLLRPPFYIHAVK